MTEPGPYEAACPLCGDVIPDVLLCGHSPRLCPGCCHATHPRPCRDCLGRGHIPYGRDRWGYPLLATCASCDGKGRVNEGGSE